ncbi:Peptidyl-tRNA hydrolase [hydrothermal vent metagenome]|uniref:peptidyl-tRNA hydrolase n=1 Tax=hydrothermal vent metagenome TaxID=652676 RepID=A0A3B1CNN2_9ZZZZ
MKLIAGLGNPGAEYENTRHNAGFCAVNFLLKKYGIGDKGRAYGAVFVTGMVNKVEVAFIKPMKYMNLSGGPIRDAMDSLEIAPKDLLVIHDDIDIELGRALYKVSGGHAGHNGLRSIMGEIKSRDFHRIRLGVNRPDEGVSVTDHVLDRFSDEEREVFLKSLSKCAEFVENRFLAEELINE